MAKIIIPRREKVIEHPNLEIEVNIGDLILFTNARNFFKEGGRTGAFLGAVHEIEPMGHTWINMGDLYFLLRKCQNFGGIVLPIYKTRCGTFQVSSFLREFYVGQEEVVKALQSWPGFEAHAEWVARLRKPYVE